MDLNKHDPDPHNVQYLLSILRGDGESGASEGQQQCGTSYNTPYQAQYPYGTYSGPVPYPSPQVPPETTPQPTLSLSPPVSTASLSSSTPTPPLAGTDPRKKSTPSPPSKSKSSTTSGTDPRKRPNSEEGSQVREGKRVREGETSTELSPQVSTKTTTAPATQASVKTPLAPAQKPTRTLQSLPAALPTLRTLSKSPKFLRLLMTLKRQQDTLERSLKYEYDELVSKKSPKDEIAKWKSEALERWDEQMELQQVQLGNAGLPNFWKTKSAVVRQAQREILDVLGGMVGGK